MSVMDKKIIDFIGVDKKNNNLVLTITDHLKWRQETDDVHLLFMQNKINYYLAFIESGEVNDYFKPEDYNKFVIRVTAKYPFNSDCVKFFNLCKPIINDAGIELEWEISPLKNESD